MVMGRLIDGGGGFKFEIFMSGQAEHNRIKAVAGSWTPIRIVVYKIECVREDL